VALGLTLSVAGCGGQSTTPAGAATRPAASGSSAPTPAAGQVGIPATVTTAAAPRATTAAAPRTTKATASTPVRTSAAGRSTIAAPKQAPASTPAAASGPSVARSVHLTDEQCGPTGLTFDVVFSDGHVVPESSPPTGSIPSVHVTGAMPYDGTFSVTNPDISC
jgi:hypothetical protein